MKKKDKKRLITFLGGGIGVFGAITMNPMVGSAIWSETIFNAYGHLIGLVLMIIGSMIAIKVDSII